MPVPATHTVPLTLSREDLWTLHHVLLARLDAEQTAAEPDTIDPPPLAVYRVFDTLETGDTRVQRTDLEPVTDMLCHDDACPPWCLGCAHLTALRQQLTQLCERHQPSPMRETANE